LIDSPISRGAKAVKPNTKPGLVARSEYLERDGASSPLALILWHRHSCLCESVLLRQVSAGRSAGATQRWTLPFQPASHLRGLSMTVRSHPSFHAQQRLSVQAQYIPIPRVYGKE
jgi:hypothetical protein